MDGPGDAPSGCDTLPTFPYDSEEAIAVSRCALGDGPAKANVISVSTAHALSLDAKGTSITWRTDFWNPSTEVRSTVFILEWETLTNELGIQECADAIASDPASSSMLVPDADARYLKLLPAATERRRWYFALERDCGATLGPPVRGVRIDEDDEASGATIFYFFRYDWNGEFVEHCGPCSGSGFACEPCTSG